VRPGAAYAVIASAKQGVNGSGIVGFEGSWRDDSHGFISDAGLGQVQLGATTGVWETISSDPSNIAPENARYLRVIVDCSSTNSLGPDRRIDVAGIKLLEVGFTVLRLRSVKDVTLSSDDHPLTIGNDSGENVGFDRNEILARNGVGVAGDLTLNREGGAVIFGGGTEAPTAELRIVTGMVVLEEQVGTVGLAGSNKANLYVTDNGSGKTSLRVRFASGGAQVIATEP
jgi:hypothetical protein